MALFFWLCQQYLWELLLVYTINCNKNALKENFGIYIGAKLNQNIKLGKDYIRIIESLETKLVL